MQSELRELRSDLGEAVRRAEDADRRADDADLRIEALERSMADLRSEVLQLTQKEDGDKEEGGNGKEMEH